MGIADDPMPAGSADPTKPTYEDVAARGSYADAGVAPKPTYDDLLDIIASQKDEIEQLKVEVHRAHVNEEWLQSQQWKHLA